MISTANISNEYKDIPSAWIFEHYCKIPESLTGQDIKITSVFNPAERNPSMMIYVWNNKYKFNDFSSGKKGDGIDLIEYLFNLDRSNSTIKILKDYSHYLSTNTAGNVIMAPAARYKITSHQPRKWNSDDAKFWTGFGIGSATLSRYNVRPLQSYTMVKADVTGPVQLVMEKPYLYGYFKNDGTLYKIYQPYNKDRKFIKVIGGYIQGWEQLTKKNDYLLITSSLKDTMGIESLGMKLDMISPDSENVLLDAQVIEELKTQYKGVLTLLDSDDAGIKAMQLYKTTFDLNFVYFNMAKDPTDGIKRFGPAPVRESLLYKINTQLEAIL